MSSHLEFTEGMQCLVRVMGEPFWVRVTEVGDEAVRLSFPGHDYPVSGMTLELELHDEQGYRLFTATMIGRGATPEDGIIVDMPRTVQARTHRTAARVETSLPVQVSDQVSIRKYAGQLMNLSQGGALLTTDAPLDFHTAAELTLSLPNEPVHELLGQVRHVDIAKRGSHRTVGIRFISPDPDAVEAIGRYIGERLRVLYPSI